MHIISNTYDTAYSRNAVTPKARFSGACCVFPSPELHQHLVRDRLVPHSRHWVNIGELKVTAPVSGPELCRRSINFFGGTYQTPCTFGNQIYWYTILKRIPARRYHKLLDRILRKRHTSTSKNDIRSKPKHRIESDSPSSSRLAREPGSAHNIHTPLHGDHIRLPQVVHSNILPLYFTVSPPINLISNLLHTFVASNKQREPVLKYRARDKVRESLGWITRSAFWTFHHEVHRPPEVLSKNL